MASPINAFSVAWQNIEYNIGNGFDGKVFVAPQSGLYSFSAMFEQYNNYVATIHIYLNGVENVFVSNFFGCLTIQKTLKITKNDKVEVRLNGKVCNTNNIRSTFFEGRFISCIDE